jgi:hypothetical protein
LFGEIFYCKPEKRVYERDERGRFKGKESNRKEGEAAVNRGLA